jgi:hypothetical protein
MQSRASVPMGFSLLLSGLKQILTPNGLFHFAELFTTLSVYKLHITE